MNNKNRTKAIETIAKLYGETIFTLSESILLINKDGQINKGIVKDSDTLIQIVKSKAIPNKELIKSLWFEFKEIDFKDELHKGLFLKTYKLINLHNVYYINIINLFELLQTLGYIEGKNTLKEIKELLNKNIKDISKNNFTNLKILQLYK